MYHRTTKSTIARAFSLLLLSGIFHAETTEASSNFDSAYVQKLTSSTISHLVHDSKTYLWLIDFYSPSCSACIRFSETWNRIGQYYSSSSHVKVGSVDCNVEYQLCAKYEIQFFPSVMAYNIPRYPQSKKQGRLFDDDSQDRTLEGIVAWVDSLLGFVDTSAGVNHSAAPLPLSSSHAIRSDGSSKLTADAQERIWDAGLALISLFQNGIFLGSLTLQHERYDAFSLILKVLGDFFPVEGNRKALKDLRAKLLEKPQWTMEAWHKVLLQWRSDAAKITTPSQLFAAPQMKACETESCTIWTTFHLLSLNIIDREELHEEIRSLELDNPNKADSASPLEFGRAVYGFTKYFFGCKECSEHFMKDNLLVQIDGYWNPNDRVGSAKAYALWLWRTHNAVNRRVQRGLWPPELRCPECYDEGHSFHNDADRQKWREGYVLQFMMKEYSHPEAWVDLKSVISNPQLLDESGTFLALSQPHSYASVAILAIVMPIFELWVN